VAKGPNHALSAIYRKIVAEDPEGYSQMMRERAHKGWRDPEFRRKRQSHRIVLSPDHETKIRDFVKERKSPWKTLACQLGISYSTLKILRREMGLPIDGRDKKFG